MSKEGKRWAQMLQNARSELLIDELLTLNGRGGHSTKLLQNVRSELLI
jgi:hypothetical protein